MSSAVVDVDTTTTLDPSAMMPHRRADRVCSLPADDSIAIEHNVYDITCMISTNCMHHSGSRAVQQAYIWKLGCLM
jgi:hypothetical protein